MQYKSNPKYMSWQQLIVWVVRLWVWGMAAIWACAAQAGMTTNATDTPKTMQMQPAVLVGAKEYNLKAKSNARSYRIQVTAVGKPPSTGYPVLYVLDGDGIFPLVSLLAQGMTMRMQENNAVPMLIVGVGYGSHALIDLQARAKDYTPSSASYDDTGDRLSTDFGGAEAFYDFLSLELPDDLLARGYAINHNQQSIFGHSYGGLFVLYALLNHPQHFRNYIATSPSIWWNHQQVLAPMPQLAMRLQGSTEGGIGVRLAAGEYEEHLAPYIPNNAERAAMLKARGMVSHTQALAMQLSTHYPQLAVAHTTYAGETHASVLMPAIHDGMKWLYQRCRMYSDCYTPNTP